VLEAANLVTTVHRAGETALHQRRADQRHRRVVSGPDAAAAAGMIFDGHCVQAADTVVIRSRMAATDTGKFPGVAPPAGGSHGTPWRWSGEGRPTRRPAGAARLWGIFQQLTAEQ
jgi:hypothetical protein